MVGLRLAYLTLALLSAAPEFALQSPLPARLNIPPILMYHRIDVDRPGDAVGRDLTVSPAQFAVQLQMLRALGLHAISMAELDRRLRSGSSLRGSVVLTFDDGYSDQARYGVPLLRKTGGRATFYVVTRTINTPRHLSSGQLRDLVKEGMDIGGHGVSHDDLSLMTATQQRHQIFGCLRRLRTELRIPIVSYAYPSGRLNAETLRIARASGVDLAVTTDPRFVIPPETRFELARIRVHGDWDAAAFRAALRGSLANPQRALR